MNSTMNKNLKTLLLEQNIMQVEHEMKSHLLEVFANYVFNKLMLYVYFKNSYQLFL